MSANKHTSQEHVRFLKQVKRERRITNLLRIGILVALFGLWELAAQLGWIDPFIMSSPSRVVDTIANLAVSGDLLRHVWVTIWETLVGFILGTVLGILVAILLWWSPRASRVTEPYLVVLNSLPKVALGPIIIVWIGAGTEAIITMALLISVVITIMNVLNGFLAVDPDKIRLMQSFGASRFQILQKVILPSNVPNIMATLKINVGMAWVGVITGEFLVAKEGIGYLIVYGGQVFQLDLVMAGVLILSVAAALMYVGVAKLESTYLKWRK